MTVTLKLNVKVEKFKCCICHKDTEGWGNNPEPLGKTTKDGMILADDNGMPIRCCDVCNSSFVIPARLKKLIKINGGK